MPVPETVDLALFPSPEIFLACPGNCRPGTHFMAFSLVPFYACPRNGRPGTQYFMPVPETVDLALVSGPVRLYACTGNGRPSTR